MVGKIRLERDPFGGPCVCVLATLRYGEKLQLLGGEEAKSPFPLNPF